MNKIIILLININIIISFTQAGKLIKRGVITEQGLYDNNDDVVVLTAEMFNNHIFNQNYASYVEFYNSYCGFCRNFAPVWKNFSSSVREWKNIAEVSALDCSVDENNDVCRKYEIMKYPTIRYFPPSYPEGPNQIGKSIEGHGQQIKSLSDLLLQELRMEPNPPKNWPDLSFITEGLHVTKNSLFSNNDKLKYVFIIYDNNGNTSTLPYEVILDLSKIPEIQVKSIHGNATELLLQQGLGVIDRDEHFMLMYTHAWTRADIVNSIIEYLKLHSVPIPKSLLFYGRRLPSSESADSQVVVKISDEDIREDLKKMKGVVFRADLEQTFKYMLFHEVIRVNTIEGERLLALQRMLNVLNNHFSLTTNVHNFIRDLQEYTMNILDSVTGENFSQKIHELEEKHKPIVTTGRWLGCRSDIDGLRRFPCGLWTLFHYLTVQAAENELSTDPLEILHAIHGYVKYFFGCTECSNHFQQMATANKIWSVPSKDEAVLWLWSAHNEVNKRLSNDKNTEDPQYPKISFPSAEYCTDCRKQINNHHVHYDINNDVDWDKIRVLGYLKQYYAKDNLSDFDSNRDLAQQMGFMQSEPNRSISNVLSDMDIRMGIFLYIACIVMLVLAVKLIVKRGYRKKMYVHDILGKV